MKPDDEEAYWWAEAHRNQLETLLGIETSVVDKRMKYSRDRNQLETLLGIETIINSTYIGRKNEIEINWKGTVK